MEDCCLVLVEGCRAAYSAADRAAARGDRVGAAWERAARGEIALGEGERELGNGSQAHRAGVPSLPPARRRLSLLSGVHNCATRCAQLETLKAQRENRIARVQQLERQLAQAREQADAKDEAIAKLRIEITESTQRIQREAGEVPATFALPLSLPLAHPLQPSSSPRLPSHA